MADVTLEQQLRAATIAAEYGYIVAMYQSEGYHSPLEAADDEIVLLHPDVCDHTRKAIMAARAEIKKRLEEDAELEVAAMIEFMQQQEKEDF